MSEGGPFWPVITERRVQECYHPLAGRLKTYISIISPLVALLTDQYLQTTCAQIQRQAFSCKYPAHPLELGLQGHLLLD